MGKWIAEGQKQSVKEVIELVKKIIIQYCGQFFKKQIKYTGRQYTDA